MSGREIEDILDRTDAMEIGALLERSMKMLTENASK